MIRSTNQELGEYALIREPKHIAKVWDAISTSLPRYWSSFVSAEEKEDPVALLAAKFGKPRAAKKEAGAEVLARLFEPAIASFDKEADVYRRFFGSETLDEFRDDPNAFKQALSKDVPIIARTLRQRKQELREWQARFRSSRGNELLGVFSNVLDFASDWFEKHTTAAYAELDAPAEFELDPLDEDDALNIAGVIGMGIKSIVLYHLDPQRFPARDRPALYGLYFLSGRGHFALPSKSSEFLMVQDTAPAPDGSFIMDQNFWYPYGLFSMYALRVYRWMDLQARSMGFAMDPVLRYVYVDRFLDSIRKQHADDLKTMRAHERFEVPD